MTRRIRPNKTCEFKIKTTRNCPYFIRGGYLRCTTNIHEILSVIVMNVDFMKSIQVEIPQDEHEGSVKIIESMENEDIPRECFVMSPMGVKDSKKKGKLDWACSVVIHHPKPCCSG